MKNRPLRIFLTFYWPLCFAVYLAGFFVVGDIKSLVLAVLCAAMFVRSLYMWKFPEAKK